MNRFALIDKLTAASAHSRFSLSLLNFVLGQVVPFNRPHRITITELTPDSCKVALPHAKRNRNHVGGMHAAAILTAGEFSSGILLISTLGAKRYRVLLKKLDGEFYSQIRQPAVAISRLSKETIDQLKSQIQSCAGQASEFTMESELYIAGATAPAAIVSSLWHISEWRKI